MSVMRDFLLTLQRSVSVMAINSSGSRDSVLQLEINSPRESVCL